MNEISLEGGGDAIATLSWQEEEERKLPAGKLLGSVILLGGVTLVAALCFAEGGGRRRRVVHLNAPPEGGGGEGGGEEPPSQGSSPWSEISNPSPLSSPEQVPLPEPQDLPVPVYMRLEDLNHAAEDRLHILWINRGFKEGVQFCIRHPIDLPQRGNIIEKVRQVHPFYFLSTIFNDELATGAIRKVMDDSQGFFFDPGKVVRSGFMGGVNRGMATAIQEGRIASYLRAFAEEVRGDPDLINRWIEVGRQNGGDWSGLVRYLLAVNGGPVYPNPPE